LTHEGFTPLKIPGSRESHNAKPKKDIDNKTKRIQTDNEIESQKITESTVEILVAKVLNHTNTIPYLHLLMSPFPKFILAMIE